MEPLTMMLASGALGVAVSLIGEALASGDREKAAQIRKDFADSYGSAALPHLDTQIAQEVGPTGLAAIQEDTALRGTQTDAMRKLAQIYEQGGMTREDQAALSLADLGMEQRAAGNAQSQQQQLASRGQSMNPALAAAMQAQSEGNVVKGIGENRYRAMADSRNRAMQAIGQSADIAGSIRGQDYGIKSNAATAQDRINQFNANSRTQAGLHNLQSQQQGFQNYMGLQGARGAALNPVAQGYENSANRTAQTANAIGQGVTSTGAGAAQYGMGQQNTNPYEPKKNPWDDGSYA